MYISGLGKNITRDLLELNLDSIVEEDDAEVEDVYYGKDPSVALITFSDRIGLLNYQLQVFRFKTQ